MRKTLLSKLEVLPEGPPSCQEIDQQESGYGSCGSDGQKLYLALPPPPSVPKVEGEDLPLVQLHAGQPKGVLLAKVEDVEESNHMGQFKYLSEGREFHKRACQKGV